MLMTLCLNKTAKFHRFRSIVSLIIDMLRSSVTCVVYEWDQLFRVSVSMSSTVYHERSTRVKRDFTLVRFLFDSIVFVWVSILCRCQVTAHKVKFSIKDSFNKWDQVRSLVVSSQRWTGRILGYSYFLILKWISFNQASKKKVNIPNVPIKILGVIHLVRTQNFPKN